MPKSRRNSYGVPRTNRVQDKLPANGKLRPYHGVSGTRRNSGKRDGTTWSTSGGAFISPGDVDGYPDEAIWDEEIDVMEELIESLPRGFTETPRKPIVAQMVNIARPAKVKGVSKQFEIVHLPRRVVALDEDEWEIPELEGRSVADDWENVYAEGEKECETRLTYSAVLRGDEEG